MRYNKSKRKIRKKKAIDTYVALPKDFHWKVLGLMLNDLGFTGSCAIDVPSPSLACDDFRNELFAAIRGRDVGRYLALCAELTPRRMCQLFGEKAESAYTFFAHYQAVSFLKKFPFRESSKNELKLAALETFFAAERACGQYNAHNFRGFEALSSKHPDFLGVIDELRADIRGLLGEKPPIDCIIGHAKHGPGVSLADLYKGGKSTNFYKWSNLPYSVTPGTLDLAKSAILADHRWIGALDDWYRRQHSIPFHQPISMDHFWKSVLEVVPGSRITTVPKTALTDRTIAIEPLINVYLQLGTDYVMRRRLKQRWHYDINDQEANQRLALEGSLSGLFATIDLSAASDSISLKICEMLLPEAWYDLLLDLRSPVTMVDEAQLTFEKISSMGNGYTFALETIIFGALTRCAVRRTRSMRKSVVYGDDIVLPTTAVPYLYELLKFAGFSVNIDKSFDSGPFRESCGKDYFLGYSVRPVFLKTHPRSVMDLFYLHNSLVVLEGELNWAWCVDFSKTRAFIRRHIPKTFRDFVGPLTKSLDTHIFDEDRCLPRNKFGQRCYGALVPKALLYKRRYRDYFFIKLMASLKGDQPVEYRWDRRRKLNTGCAFDITRRDHVHYFARTVALP